MLPTTALGCVKTETIYEMGLAQECQGELLSETDIIRLTC